MFLLQSESFVPMKKKKTKAIARGIALFWGIFPLLNILGGLRSPGFDMNIWWVDFRPMPEWISTPVLATAAVLLMAFAIRPTMSLHRKITTIAFVLVPFVVGMKNTIVFFHLVKQGTIVPGTRLPLSFFVAHCLIIVMFSMIRRIEFKCTPLANFQVACATIVCGLLFPVAMMYCFGKTDYRRPADAVVVFGARVYADGSLSNGLRDRVRTGCDLVLDGTVEKIIFSGGPGDGDIHETQAMRDFAINYGVSPEKILLDPEGLNTRSTVENTVLICRQNGLKKILTVSHFYHLPRIKMTYQRYGVDAMTVPAKEERTMRKLPFFIVREIAAIRVSYIKG